MPQRRRLHAGSQRPVLAAVLAITLIASAALGIGGIQKTQNAGLDPIAASLATTSFDGGENVVVEDSAITAQGEEPGPRNVKEFSRDEPFSLFALSWQGQRDLAAFFRAQREDGSWGPWYDADLLNEEVTDRTGTEPIFLEPTHKVQVAVHGVQDAAGIDAVFIDGRADQGGIALAADTEGASSAQTQRKCIQSHRLGYGRNASVLSTSGYHTKSFNTSETTKNQRTRC